MELMRQTGAPPIDRSFLASDSSQQYPPDTSMSVVIDALMIDRWDDSVEYKQYFSRCKPLQCSYTITTRGNALYIFSTIIGVFGGLAVSLKMFSKVLVMAVRYRKRPQTGNANAAGKLQEIAVSSSRKY